MCWRVGGNGMEQSIVSIVCLCDVVGWPKLSELLSPVVRASNSTRKDPSSSPRRAEYLHENSYNIVDF